MSKELDAIARAAKVRDAEEFKELIDNDRAKTREASVARRKELEKDPLWRDLFATPEWAAMDQLWADASKRYEADTLPHWRGPLVRMDDLPVAEQDMVKLRGVRLDQARKMIFDRSMELAKKAGLNPLLLIHRPTHAAPGDETPKDIPQLLKWIEAWEWCLRPGLMPYGMKVPSCDIRQCAKVIRDLGDRIRTSLSNASASDRKEFWVFVHICDPTDGMAYDADRAMKMLPELRALLESLVIPNDGRNDASMANEPHDFVTVSDGDPSDVAAAVPTPVFYRRNARQPKELAVMAYRLSFVTGRPQAEIASLLQQQAGKPISQGQVSRWISSVERFVARGNILPDPPKQAAKSKSMDPSRIDIGERTDGRTPRQRHKQSEGD